MAEQRGPSFESMRKVRKGRGLVTNLTTPKSILELQTALHAKAKREPNFRFYSLFDKVGRQDILLHAWRCCRSNAGSAGVDGISFQQIEDEGLESWLGLLAQEIREGKYRPQAIRRVFIPKANGKSRPLGIGTIKDRVVQMAVVLVLTPIFEADLCDSQFGFRHGKNAHQAIRQIHSFINQGHYEIVDADLKEYFDSIPHLELLKCLSRRISDGSLLSLVKMWLVCPIATSTKSGGFVMSNPAKQSKRGTPQGSPLSPLLSNIYMRRFILGWEKLGYQKRYAAQIVSYADDFVICCRGTGNGGKAHLAMKELMQKIRLTINDEKTRVCHAWESPFDFLGYTVGVCYSWRTGKAFIGTKPSRKSVKKICLEVSRLTRHSTKNQPLEETVKTLNQALNGWANYFSVGVCSATYKALDFHSRYRLRQWLRAKHKLQGVPKSRFTDGHLHNTMQLTRLVSRKRILSHAKA